MWHTTTQSNISILTSTVSIIKYNYNDKIRNNEKQAKIISETKTIIVNKHYFKSIEYLRSLKRRNVA